MIVPTIGRVVLVKRLGSSDQMEPALVTYVWNDRLINVGGFDRNGSPFSLTSLPLVQEGDPLQEGNYATWMPYQVQAAKKDEQAAKTN